MLTSSVISYIGVFVFFVGLLLLLFEGIFFFKKVSSLQWNYLTWWKKYVQPLILVMGTCLMICIGLTVMMAYGNRVQVTYEDLSVSFQFALGFSGCLWMGLLYAYYLGVIWTRAHIRGATLKIGKKK